MGFNKGINVVLCGQVIPDRGCYRIASFPQDFQDGGLKRLFLVHRDVGRNARTFPAGLGYGIFRSPARNENAEAKVDRYIAAGIGSASSCFTKHLRPLLYLQIVDKLFTTRECPSAR